MSVKISVTGLKEIDEVVKGLPLLMQDRVLKTAHADAAKVGVEAAKNIVPVKKGTLRDSIGIERVSLKRTTEVGLVQYGPLRRKKGFHGHLIEYGKTNRDGTKTQPDPFMATSFQQTKGVIESNIATSLGKKVLSFMKRTIKNG
jgi:hypothetical protein